MYQVFAVDVCFAPYATNVILVGAESIEDLKDKIDLVDINEWYEYSPREDLIKELKNDLEERCKPVEGVYTERPYQQLFAHSYYE